MPDLADHPTDPMQQQASAGLAEIMEEAAGRPLTAEERARAHQHAADMLARLDASIREHFPDV